jgi:hypothetical protein
MAQDKKDEQAQQEHIPTEPQDEGQEEGNKGSGGLLSAIGDPVGTFFFPLSPPYISLSLSLISSYLPPFTHNQTNKNG